ncbi:hypothetical protein [Actinoplanes palleronii]|uniref:LPXTG-motif cell wall-anchored protein n=1 Tax=Actinoplanes palleronii TaxID=113570 RepID=A0ABQ4BK45_9ACTN|nr:hypothetical protein [Actinoplanes palleronii]GIE71056.1 hypothetical protein Apa02nite_071640 [Actinoplanes palleronii]
MKKARFLRAALVLVSAVLGAGTVATTSTAAFADEATVCTSADFEATDFVFQNGLAETTATLKAGSNCQAEVTLVTYLAPKPNFDVPQYLFGSQTELISRSGNTSKGFSVKVPACNTQADLFVGGQNDVINELVKDGKRYGTTKIAFWNGSADKDGSASSCVQPAVQYTAACDGVTTLNLSNNGVLSGYGVDFTVKYGSETKVVTVAKGASEDLTVPAGSGPITVTADKLQPTTINWALPAACEPAATAVNDCKVTTVTVTNPEGNGDVPAKVTYNGETKTVTVPTGKSVDVTFDSAKATTATVEFPESKFEQLTVEVVLGECAEPQPSTSASTSPPVSLPPTAATSPSASASTSTSPAAATPSASKTPGGELALTGAAGGSIAGGAVLLLIVGAGLFFMARRRKVNFKA